ncbi:MAG: hypothetical protein ACYDG2_16650 [Ruminiclostridium sp.]
MAEYCKCGSIMIDGSCTHKSCSNKLVKASSSRAKTAKVASTKTPAVKTELKSTKVRRASKCITYNINDLLKKEE